MIYNGIHFFRWYSCMWYLMLNSFKTACVSRKKFECDSISTRPVPVELSRSGWFSTDLFNVSRMTLTWNSSKLVGIPVPQAQTTRLSHGSLVGWSIHPGPRLTACNKRVNTVRRRRKSDLPAEWYPRHPPKSLSLITTGLDLSKTTLYGTWKISLDESIRFGMMEEATFRGTSWLWLYLVIKHQMCNWVERTFAHQIYSL